MNFVYTNYVSFATGTSLNSSYTLIAAGPNGDFCYNFSTWNECPSGVRIAVATTTPSDTTTQHAYVPANATSAKDTRQSRYMLSSGHNIYARTAATSIVSGTLTIEFW